jgi:hypothetical protein
MQKDTYSEEDIVTVSVAESVCQNPKLWMANGTIEEVYAFLRGCNAIIMNFRLKVRPPTPQDALNWIYSENNKLGEGLDLVRLRSKFGSDAATLACLLESIQALRPTDDPLGEDAS